MQKTANVTETIEYWQEKDKTNSLSAGMSVGITVEDEFFNKRGEVITHQENAPHIADTFKANIFWMGKNTLEKGKKYKIKVATQEIECEISSINKVIDASSLEILVNANGVKTNDVAEITIKTKGKICFDEFKNNQNTGRFVLVEGYDVTGGGIITGLEISIQSVCKLVKKDSEFPVSCFDEYYYILSENNVRKLPRIPVAFSINDVIPVAGNTYAYPEDFDIVDLQTKLVAKIRKSLFQDIESFDSYNYENKQIINSKGFAINIHSQDDFDRFENDLLIIKNVDEFTNVWYDFNAFRKIKFIESLQSIDFDI